MVVDDDVKGAVGPRDVSELVEALGFTCVLISGGDNDVLNFTYLCPIFALNEMLIILLLMHLIITYWCI